MHIQFFLPGINESTHRTDGSVRVYYGADIFYKEDTIQYSGYQTINFKNQKISTVWGVGRLWRDK